MTMMMMMMMMMMMTGTFTKLQGDAVMKARQDGLQQATFKDQHGQEHTVSVEKGTSSDGGKMGGPGF
jgi:hypothetical protein